MLRYTDRQLRVAFYMTSACAVLAGLWLNIEPFACPVPHGLLGQPGDAPCLEFWLSRYQTLITGAAAIVAAWLATRPVYAQLREMARQSAATARPIAVDRLKSLQAEKLRLADVQHLETEIEDYIYGRMRDPRLIDGYSTLIERMRGFIAEQQGNAAQHWDDHNLVMCRSGALMHLTELSHHLRVAMAFCPPSTDRDARPAAMLSAGANPGAQMFEPTSGALVRWIRAKRHYDGALDSAVRRAQAWVRHIEETAEGPARREIEDRYGF